MAGTSAYNTSGKTESLSAMYGSKGADRDPEAERKLRETQAAAAPDTPASPLHPPPLLTVLSHRRPPLISDPPPLPFADGREAGSREGAPQGAEAREGGAAGGMGQAAGDRPFHSTMHRCDTALHDAPMRHSAARCINATPRGMV
mgnify:CR=1 FL=1